MSTLILEKEEWHDSETDSCANSIWTKILGFFHISVRLSIQLPLFCCCFLIFFLIHMKLFKCFNDESFVSQCLEIMPHKVDSSKLSSIHKNHGYSIPNEGSFSMVQIHVIVFDFWIKGTSKPKPITFKRHPWSFLSSGKRVIILTVSMGWMYILFQNKKLWIRSYKYYLFSNHTDYM